NRDLVDLLGGQDRGRFDRGHVDRVDDVGADHGDGPEGGGAGAAGEVDVGGNAHVDADLTRGAAVLADLVGAGRQGREAVVAVGTDGDRAAEAGGRVADGDDVARIGTTGNRTGSVGLGVGTADEAQTQGRGQCASLQVLRKLLGSHELVTPL